MKCDILKVLASSLVQKKKNIGEFSVTSRILVKFYLNMQFFTLNEDDE